MSQLGPLRCEWRPSSHGGPPGRGLDWMGHESFPRQHARVCAGSVPGRIWRISNSTGSLWVPYVLTSIQVGAKVAVSFGWKPSLRRQLRQTFRLLPWQEPSPTVSVSVDHTLLVFWLCSAKNRKRQASAQEQNKRLRLRRDQKLKVLRPVGLIHW